MISYGKCKFGTLWFCVLTMISRYVDRPRCNYTMVIVRSLETVVTALEMFSFLYCITYMECPGHPTYIDSMIMTFTNHHTSYFGESIFMLTLTGNGIILIIMVKSCQIK